MTLKGSRMLSGADEGCREGFLVRNRDRKRHGRRGGRRLTGPVLVVCALLAVLAALDHWSNAGKVYPGVEVGGVPLGGKTPEEAREDLEERASETLAETEFVGPGGGFSLSREDMGVDHDVAASVEEAYAVGRRGDIVERLGERLRTAFGTVGVPPEVEYEPGVARLAVENAARRVNEEPRDASVAVVGGEVEVKEAQYGYALDVPRTMRNVEEALHGLSGEVRIAGERLEPEIPTWEAERAAEKARRAISEPMILSAEGREWELSSAEVGRVLDFVPGGKEIRIGLNQDRLKDRLASVYAALTVEPVEAGYEVNDRGVTVTPSREGRSVEEEKFLGAIEDGIFEGKHEYEVPVVAAEPQLTTAEAESLKPTELLATYRTDYTLSSDQSPERVENLAIASNAISGTLLAPGQVFSANEILAPLDYNATKVIIEGREAQSNGGGLCQVTSTLYMAANYAGLDVIERHPHSAQLPYIRPGLDATVWFGSLDMKFENTTEAYVLVREYVADNGYIYAEIYGRPNGTEVEMTSKPTYMGDDYSEWVTYQTVKKDGEVLYDGILHKDTYLPLVDEKGNVIPPPDVPVMPVSP